MTAPHNPIITLTTDFGRSDGYVGTMEGVILGICPNATISHLSHQIPAQNINTGAFVLYQSFGYYPAHTVHCVVVDPGVGSNRRAVAVRTGQGIFVAPDNGILSLVLNVSKVQEAVTLTNPAYRLSHTSATFHGRDIFSPAAAHIAAGVPLNQLGTAVTALVQQEIFDSPGGGQSRIIHIDHFGNIVLDITAQKVKNPKSFSITTGKHTIRSISRTFADAKEGDLLAYIGSSRDHIEIAIRNGSAAQVLGLRQGDVVQISQ